VFLRRLAKVMELFRLGTRGTHLSKEVLLDNLGLDALGITLCAHLFKGVRESHQSILPHGDGTLPAIQLPLSGMELPLQLNGRCQHSHHIRRRSPTPINKRRSALWQEASPGSHRRIVKLHLVDSEAQLGAASILT
jgi:hypothetical protein